VRAHTFLFLFQLGHVHCVQLLVDYIVHRLLAEFSEWGCTYIHIVLLGC
jgi:hypothetical protein